VSDALLLIDCVQTLDFDGGEALREPYLALAEPLAGLRARAYAARVPVIWVNDHFGDWRRSFPELVAEARRGPGGPFLERLSPAAEDYQILKPRHSAFFQTPLEGLLRSLGTRRVVLCGVQAHACVLFTAHDAHMWEYEVAIPTDGVASERAEDVDAALHVVRRTMRADIGCCGDLTLGR
jgi:nicotinamidase-related amidase